MDTILVPCPNCGEPIPLGFWDFGFNRTGCDGFCPECHGRYRFSAKTRFAGVMGVLALLAAVIVGSVLLHFACAACRDFRDSPLHAFAPLIAALAFIGGWMLPPALAMRASARSLLRSRRGLEILDSLEPKARRLQLKLRLPAARRDPSPAGPLAVAVAFVVAAFSAVSAAWHQLAAGRLSVHQQPLSVFDRDGHPVVFWFCVGLELLLAALGAIVAVRAMIEFARRKNGIY
jgi:hypothetical protein